MPPAAAADALRPLPAGYLELYQKLLGVAESDDRIRAMWLSGSVGRGVADAGSDLDIVLAIAAEWFDDFAATWRDWLARVTPTVLAKELPDMPGSWYSVTPSCLRLDIVTERARAARADELTRRLLILDKDGSRGETNPRGHTHPRADTPRVPPATHEDRRAQTFDGPGPDGTRLAGITEEFLRQQALFPAAVVARADWLLGVVGVQNVQMMLYQLFVESNQPLPPMGVKQWSAKLTPEQRRILASLPAPTADRSGVLDAMRAGSVAFRQAAGRILAANGVPWPLDLDEAVRSYHRTELGWT